MVFGQKHSGPFVIRGLAKIVFQVFGRVVLCIGTPPVVAVQELIDAIGTIAEVVSKVVSSWNRAAYFGCVHEAVVFIQRIARKSQDVVPGTCRRANCWLTDSQRECSAMDTRRSPAIGSHLVEVNLRHGPSPGTGYSQVLPRRAAASS